jgi:endonuclease/exonuclease/phosphatase family metal-dependent hydrolase
VEGREHLLVNRDLSREFTAFLAAAEWDVALLQEVPPRWASRLARAAGAGGYRTLTSRNWMRPVTGPVARVRPHLAGSWEGGSNLILVRDRGPGSVVVKHSRATLRLRPERRVVSLVRLADGLCVANFHASTGSRAGRDVERAASAAAMWASESPLVLGGDFNLRPGRSREFDRLEKRHGLTGPTGPDSIDHLLVRGAGIEEPARAWPAGRRDVPDPGTGLLIRLSDHAPVTSLIES